MLYNNYFDVTVIVESNKITFQYPESPPKGYEVVIDDNSIKIELRTSRVIQKFLTIIKENQEVLETEDFVFLGELLYKIMFGNNTGDQLMNSIINMNLKESHTACRIFLQFNDNSFDLPILPWEYTLFREKDEPIFLSANKDKKRLLIRRVVRDDKKMDNYQPAPANKLNVVFVSCTETDNETIDSLDVRPVLKMLEQLKAENEGVFCFEHLHNENEESFTKAFATAVNKFERVNGQQPAYVVHYFGHADMRDQKGKIVFKSEKEGKVYWMDDDDFSDKFCQKEVLNKNQIERRPELFILQACNSAKIGDYKKGMGVALSLVNKEIPAVIGMQNEIDKTSSTAFVREVYKSLLVGHDVAEAVTIGRDYLGKTHNVRGDQKGYKNNTFGSPVLFISTQIPISILKPASDGNELQISLSQNAEHGFVLTAECNSCGNKLTENDTICSKCRKDVTEITAALKKISSSITRSTEQKKAEVSPDRKVSSINSN